MGEGWDNNNHFRSSGNDNGFGDDDGDCGVTSQNWSWNWNLSWSWNWNWNLSRSWNWNLSRSWSENGVCEAFYILDMKKIFLKHINGTIYQAVITLCDHKNTNVPKIKLYGYFCNNIYHIR
jgi:hypothetical protein